MMSGRVFVLCLCFEAAILIYGAGWFLKHTMDALTKALLP